MSERIEQIEVGDSGDSGTGNSLKTATIVKVTQNVATELNDLLNAIGLRIFLLSHQLADSPHETEVARLAELIDKATRCVRRMQEYIRAEQLVASMRPAMDMARPNARAKDGSARRSPRRSRSALLIVDRPADNGAIEKSLQRSGCTVVVADSPQEGLKLLLSGRHFDHIVCDSALLAGSERSFTSELASAARASRVYVLTPGA